MYDLYLLFFACHPYITLHFHSCVKSSPRTFLSVFFAPYLLCLCYILECVWT